MKFKPGMGAQPDPGFRPNSKSKIIFFKAELKIQDSRSYIAILHEISPPQCAFLKLD